jgi:hypothetical protein
MTKNWIKLTAVVALAAAFLAFRAAPAHALYELQVSTDGGSTWAVYHSTNGGLTWLDSLNVNQGNAVFADQLAITASSTNFLSGPLSTMDLRVSGTQTTQLYNLLVQASVTDVPTLPPPQIMSWAFTSSSDLGALTQTGEGWVDKNNAVFGTGNIIADTGTLTAPASGSIGFNDAAKYSWTEQFKLTGQGRLGHQISADNNEMITTPAPDGLLLVLSGMPLLSVGYWLRRRVRPATAA